MCNDNLRSLTYLVQSIKYRQWEWDTIHNHRTAKMNHIWAAFNTLIIVNHAETWTKFSQILTCQTAMFRKLQSSWWHDSLARSTQKNYYLAGVDSYVESGWKRSDEGCCKSDRIRRRRSRSHLPVETLPQFGDVCRDQGHVQSSTHPLATSHKASKISDI